MANLYLRHLRHQPEPSPFFGVLYRWWVGLVPALLSRCSSPGEPEDDKFTLAATQALVVMVLYFPRVAVLKEANFLVLMLAYQTTLRASVPPAFSPWRFVPKSQRSLWLRSADHLSLAFGRLYLTNIGRTGADNPEIERLNNAVSHTELTPGSCSRIS